MTGRLTPDELAEVDRLLDGALVRPHELDDDPAGTHDFPSQLRPVVELVEIDRLSRIKE